MEIRERKWAHAPSEASFTGTGTGPLSQIALSAQKSFPVLLEQLIN
jgi:hypothetical protein